MFKGFVNSSYLIQVPQGYVAVEYQFGKLMNKLHDPGYSLVGPFSKAYYVQTSVQTDMVTNIPCGTKGGVMIHFDKIEVVNVLPKEYVIETVRNYTIEYDQIWIFDRIHKEINDYCSLHTLEEIYITEFDQLDEHLIEGLLKTTSHWAPGINILSIRVTKPIIPDKILKKFSEVEQVKANQSTLEQRHNTLVQTEQTLMDKSLTASEREIDVTEIELRKMLEQKKSALELAKVQFDIYKQSEFNK